MNVPDIQAGGDPCSDPDAPRNWVFAETTWDTGSLDAAEASYWKFWLVTWLENDGPLVAEIPGHGLTAIPGSDLISFLDLPIETYSNMGFYDQVFALLPPSSDAAGATVLAARARTPPRRRRSCGSPRPR